MLAVVTTAIPERLGMLHHLLESIETQTLRPDAHLVHIDYEKVGPAASLNRVAMAAVAAGADWVAQIADDDLAYPHHLETLVDASADADIVYSWCDVEGRPWNPNSPFDAERLRYENYVPGTTLIRSTLIQTLGGWRPEAAHSFEDWDFWLRALDAGARFVCVPTVTWLYRFHGDNLSWRS